METAERSGVSVDVESIISSPRHDKSHLLDSQTIGEKFPLGNSSLLEFERLNLNLNSLDDRQSRPHEAYDSNPIPFSVEKAIHSGLVKRRVQSKEGLFEWIHVYMGLLQQDERFLLCFIERPSHSKEVAKDATNHSSRKAFEEVHLCHDYFVVEHGDIITPAYGVDPPPTVLRFTVTKRATGGSLEHPRKRGEESFLCTTHEECAGWVSAISRNLELLNPPADTDKLCLSHDTLPAPAHLLRHGLSSSSKFSTEPSQDDSQRLVHDVSVRRDTLDSVNGSTSTLQTRDPVRHPGRLMVENAPMLESAALASPVGTLHTKTSPPSAPTRFAYATQDPRENFARNDVKSAVAKRSVKAKRKPPVPVQRRTRRSKGRTEGNEEMRLEVTIPSRVKTIRRTSSTGAKPQKKQSVLTQRNTNFQGHSVSQRDRGRKQVSSSKGSKASSQKVAKSRGKKKGQVTPPGPKKRTETIGREDVTVENSLSIDLMSEEQSHFALSSRDVLNVAKLQQQHKEQIHAIEELLLQESSKLRETREKLRKEMESRRISERKLNDITAAYERSADNERHLMDQVIELESQLTRMKDSSRVDEAGAVSMVRSLEATCDVLKKQALESTAKSQGLQLQVERLAEDCANGKADAKSLEIKNKRLLEEVAELRKMVYGTSKRPVAKLKTKKKSNRYSNVRSSGYGITKENHAQSGRLSKSFYT